MEVFGLWAVQRYYVLKADLGKKSEAFWGGGGAFQESNV